MSEKKLSKKHEWVSLEGDRATVGIIFVKFWDTGSNIVPATSQNIAAIKKI